MNSIIFFGDSKDNLIFKYDFTENKYITLNLDTNKSNCPMNNIANLFPNYNSSTNVELIRNNILNVDKIFKEFEFNSSFCSGKAGTNN